MCVDFDGHHSGGSSFVYVYEIWILLLKKKKQVKSPSIWSRTPNSVRIRQLGRTGNRGMTAIIANPIAAFLIKSMGKLNYSHIFL